MLFTKQQAQEFEGLRSKFGDASILEEMANQKPEKKAVIDSLRQGGFADSDIVSEFLKQKSTWKLPSTQWQGMTPQVQKSYQQRYNIEFVPVGKPQQAIPAQPEPEKPSILQWGGKAITGPINAVEGAWQTKAIKPVVKASVSLFTPSPEDIENLVNDKTRRADLVQIISAGHVPTNLNPDFISNLQKTNPKLASMLTNPKANVNRRGEISDKNEMITNLLTSRISPIQKLGFALSEEALNQTKEILYHPISNALYMIAFEGGTFLLGKIPVMRKPVGTVIEDIGKSIRSYHQTRKIKMTNQTVRDYINQEPKIPQTVKDQVNEMPEANLSKLTSELRKSQGEVKVAVPKMVSQELRQQGLKAEETIRKKALEDQALEKQSQEFIAKETERPTLTMQEKAPEKPIETPPEVKAEIPQEQAKPTELQGDVPKEPYEMTKQEFSDSAITGMDAYKRWSVVGDPDANTYYKGSRGSVVDTVHKKIVEKSLSEGKEVPDSVLADYPDLAKTVQKEPTKPLSAEQRVVASGKELTPQAVVDEMTPDELAKVVSTPKDEYIHQDLSPEAYAVFTHKVRKAKEGFEDPLVTEKNIEDYLGKVKKITDFDNNPSEYRSIYEDVYAKKPRYAEAQKKIEKLLGIEHDKAIATAGKMDKGTRTIFDETVHTYATRKVKATTPEPKAETPIPEAPKVSPEEGKTYSKNKPEDTKIDVGIMSPVLRKPDKVHEYKGYTFGEANQNLAGGNFRYIEAWNKETGEWEFIDSRKTVRAYSQKEIDWLIENRADKFDRVPIDYERVNPDYEISKTPKPYVTKYGLSNQEYKWDSYKVKIDKYPEKDLIIYKTNSGWILRDNDVGASLGKERKGIGWVGFGSKEEAVNNYISKIKQETLDLTIARPDEIVPPEDLIRRFMDRNGYTREEAIEDIRKHGGFASFGFKQKPSLAQNPSKVHNDVINQYAEGISMEAEKEKFGMGKVWQSFQTLYNWTVHRYQPITRITNFAQKGGIVKEGENPLLLAKRYSGVEKIASEKIFKETRMRNPDGSSTVTGEGLAQVLEPVTQDIKDFSAYLAAERDIELMSRDVAIKGSPKQAEAYATINAIKSKYGTNFKVFEDTAQGFRDWTKRAMLDELKDIGFLSQKNYDDILDSNRFYAPFQRVMDIMERRGVIPSSKEAFTPQGKPIHKIVGSERQVIDPLENAITNCYKITDFIERQRVANATINLRNIDPRLQTVITKGRGRYEIPVYENGVRKLYNVPKDLHTALKGMDEADMGTFMRIISFPTRTLRAGATLIPEFWFRNPIRDQFTAFVNAKYGYYPGYDFIKGMFHVLKKDDLYHEAAASGAFQSMFTSLDRMTSRATLEDVLRGRQKYWSPKHPIEAVRSLSQFFEEGTRIGVYGRAKSGGDILYKAFHRGEPKPSESGAMFEYREASTDFSRRGSQTKAMNQLIAFFNANIQGVDKMVRSFKDRPLEASIRAISSITIPTITLYMINKDNPRYKELPQWEKDFFWIIIPSDKAPIIRIPKPFELGILFGTSAEHIIDYIETKDPEAVKTLGNSAWQALTPGVIPTGLQPPIESWADKNLFTNRPIVPSSLKKLPPEMQYEHYTSETAKAVGTWIKYSPMKVDNAIRGYFGGMGKYFTDSVDVIIKKYGVERPPEPTKTAADIPLLRGFVAREPIGSVSESVNQFYKVYTKIEQANSAIKQYQKQGNTKKAVEYIKEHPEARFMSGFTTTMFSMAKTRRAIQAIYDSKTMTPANKRKAIDELNTLITRQAKLALDVYDNAKKGESEPAKPERRKSIGHPVGLEYLNE